MFLTGIFGWKLPFFDLIMRRKEGMENEIIIGIWKPSEEEEDACEKGERKWRIK